MGSKVLLLHEDASLCAEVQRALSPLGCAFTVIREGNAGLARAVSDRFDLIIVSLELPGMNGYRICNRIKKDPAARKTPVFLLTDEDNEGAFQEHQQLGTRAEAYFAKPVQMNELAARAKFYLSADPIERALDDAPSELARMSPAILPEQPPGRPVTLIPRPATGGKRSSQAPPDPALAQAHYKIQQTLREKQAELTRTEKLLAIAQGERAQSTRKVDDLSARLGKAKAEIDAQRQAFDDERAAFAAERADGASNVARATALVEQLQAEKETRLAEESRARDLARDTEIARARADFEASLADLGGQLAAAETSLADARAALAQAEQRSRDEDTRMVAELAAVREEERRRFQQEMEHERGRQEQERAAMLAQAEGQVEKRWRGAEDEAVRSLGEAKQRVLLLERQRRQETTDSKRALEALERQIAAEREQRALEVASHKRALEEAWGGREVERAAAEKRLAKQQTTLAETFASRDEVHARELAEVRARYEAALESLRREIGDTRAQGEEALEWGVARRVRELEGEHESREAALRAEHAADLAAALKRFEETKEALQKKHDQAVVGAREAERELRREVAQRDGVVLDLQRKMGSVEEEKVRLLRAQSRLEEVEQILQEERALRKIENARQVEELARLAAMLTREHEVWERRLSQQSATHARALAAEESEHAELLVRERAVQEAALDDARQELANQSAAFELRVEAAVARKEDELRREFEPAIVRLRAERNDAVALARRELDEQRILAQKEREAALRALEERAREAIRKMQVDWQLRLEEAEQAAASARAKEARESEAARRVVAEQQAALLAEKRARSEDSSQFAQALSAMSRADDEARAQALQAHHREQEAAHAVALQARDLAHEKSLAALRREHEGELAARERLRADDRRAAEEERTRAVAERDAELRAELDLRLKDERAQLDRDLQRAREELARLAAGLESDAATTRAELEQEKLRIAVEIEAERERRARERELEIAALEAKHAAERSQTGEVIERLELALAATKEARATDATTHVLALERTQKERARERADAVRLVAELEERVAESASERQPMAEELAALRVAHAIEVERLRVRLASGVNQEAALVNAADSERKLRVATDVHASELDVAQVQARSAMDRKVEELRASLELERDAKNALEQLLRRARESNATHERELRELEHQKAVAEEGIRIQIEDVRRKSEEIESSVVFQRERWALERAALEKMLADLTETRAQERAQAERRAAEQESGLAGILAAQGRAHGAALAALAVEHDQALTAQRRELEAAEARAAEARASEIVALRRKLEEQAAASSTLLQPDAQLITERQRAEQAGLLQRAKELGADEVREEMRARTRELEADRDRRIAALEETLAEAQRSRELEVRRLQERHAADGSEAERALVLAQLERDRAISDLELRFSGQLAEVERAEERKLLAAREEARKAALVEADRRYHHEIEELNAEWRNELEAERQLRADILNLGEASESEAAPELVARRLERELHEARAELPELESEIAVLRGELTILRVKLENETAIARAASEQLEENRALLARAEKALADARQSSSRSSESSEVRAAGRSRPPT